MRRKNMYFLAIAAILAITVVFAVFASGADEENIGFLNSFGWQTDGKCIEKQEIIIPDPFDLVYENYNKLQLDSGFDLRPYKGKTGMRYTYIVTNYPIDVQQEVRANIICIDGLPVGGDICTVALDGFMHGLKKRNTKEIQK